MSVMSPTGGTAIYTRDALDRPIRRSNGTTAIRYAYGGFSDAPVALLNDAYSLTERLVTMPGGVLVSIDTSAQKKWSFPNLQGHYITTTNAAGIRQGSVVTYDPWGTEQPAGAFVNNTTTPTDLDAHGAQGKLTERIGSKPIVLMGARPYVPADGRFLSVDPVAGGCANSYVYVYGDPVNSSDLDGRDAFCPFGTNGGKGGQCRNPIRGAVGHAQRGLSSAAQWVSDNKCEILQAVAVVAGLATLVTTGNVALAYAVTSVAASVAAGIIADKPELIAEALVLAYAGGIAGMAAKAGRAPLGVIRTMAGLNAIVGAVSTLSTPRGGC